MGGEGSGRRPDPTNVALRALTNQPVMINNREGMVLPNYSGLQTYVKKGANLSGSQVMGDTLVLSGSAVLPAVYGDSVKMMIHQRAAGQVARLKFKADSGFTSFLFDSSPAAPANTGKWQIVSNPSGFFYLSMLNDAENSETQVFLVDRVNNMFNITMPITMASLVQSNGIYDDMGNSGVIQIGDVYGVYTQTHIAIDGSTGNVGFNNFNTLSMNGNTAVNGETVVTSGGVRNIVNGLIVA